MIYFHNKYSCEDYQTINPFVSVISWLAVVLMIIIALVMYSADEYAFQNKNKKVCLKKIIHKIYKFFNYTPSDSPAAPFGPQ
jgi:hypothetical protein